MIFFNLLNSTYGIQKQFTESDIGSLNSDIDGRYDGYISYSTWWTTTYIVKNCTR